MALVETYSCPQCGTVNRVETNPPETNQEALTPRACANCGWHDEPGQGVRGTVIKKWVLRGLSWEEAA